MANIRLTVVIRKDLQLLEGLLAAQVAHMNDQFMRLAIVNRKVEEKPDMTEIEPLITDLFKPHELEWMKDPYLSVLAVQCLEDLDAVIEHASSENIKTIIWKDTIPSPTFPDKAIKVKVGVSIGPVDFDRIKIVTSSLRLY